MLHAESSIASDHAALLFSDKISPTFSARRAPPKSAVNLRRWPLPRWPTARSLNDTLGSAVFLETCSGPGGRPRNSHS